MKRLITLLACAAALSGCALHVTDKNFLRPVVSGELEISNAVLPKGYTVSTDKVATADGNTLYRARFTHPKATSTLIFFGGNQSTVGKFAVETATQITQDWQPNLVFVDYRGYGQSSGTPTIEAISADALLIYDSEAKVAAADGKKLIVAGYSLGSVVAGGLIEQRTPDGAILICTVSNVPDMLSTGMPWYVKPFVSVSFDQRLAAIDNLRAVKNYRGPLLVIAAEKDDQTPALLSARVFEASASPVAKKLFATAMGSGHNQVLSASETRSALRTFASNSGF